MAKNFSFEEDEEWDLDLIQDLVRKEEEAIAAKKSTQQLLTIPSSYGGDSTPTYHENRNQNNSNNYFNDVHSPGLDSYLYSFSPPRGFTDSSKIKACTDQLGIQHNNATQPGFRNKSSAQFGFQNNNSTQSGFQNNSSSQPDKNASLLKKEVDRLLEQLIFQDQEKLELSRDRDEKEQKLRRALESLAAKEAELERLKKTSLFFEEENICEEVASRFYEGDSNDHHPLKYQYSRRADAIQTSKRKPDCSPGQEEELLCRKKTAQVKHVTTEGTSSSSDAIPTSKRKHDCSPGQEEQLICRKKTAQPKYVTTEGASSRSDADATIINLSYKLRRIWDPAENRRWETNIVSQLFVLCEMDIYALLWGTQGSYQQNSKVSNDMVYNDLSEGGHMVNGDKDIEADKLHALSLDLHAILAKVEIVESALCILNCTLRYECSFRRETAERGNFQGYAYKGISGLLNSHHKRSNESLQSQDLNKLASDGNINVDDCMFPQTFSSRIFFCNRSLGKIDWKAANNTGLDRNMPPVNEAISDKQMLTTAREACSPHFVNWVALFKKICQVALDSASIGVKLQAISTMNLIVMKSHPDSEREQYGQILFYRSLSEFLRKKVGVDVQLQAVQLLFLLLNCPRLFKLFCCCKEDIEMHIDNDSSNLDVSCTEGTNEMVLQGLVECISRTGFDMQVYTLRRRALHVLAFIAASGNMGIACLLNFTHSGSNNLPEQKSCLDSGRSDSLQTENTRIHNSDSVKKKNVHVEHRGLQSSNDAQQQRTNILLLLVALLNSEIDEEEKDVAKVDDAVEEIHKERATLVREALVLLHSLACNPTYEASVLRMLTNGKLALRLSLSVVQRIANRSFIYSRSGGVQMPDTNQSDTMELAKELQQKILSHARDVW
ncbi:uncharacterized protein LOC131069374 isoform X2 [Cryptomeria japonica]|uniref:uncharacterized protein LOC131069374 isoform X2 n=1 Tax=Cryptomeria japonica TaxID=3369 RepID=UPI0027DA80C3|nr:uncharacterized protein LOC131069374 isoform X2 [Cryptomeria japonica]